MSSNQLPKQDINELYKYRGTKFVRDELEGSYLYFPYRHELNDPYDCHDNLIDVEIDTSVLSDYIKEHAHTRFQGNDLDRLKQNSTQFAESIKVNFKNDIIMPFLNNIGIGSFTFQPTNFMLWAFYAQNHTGVCYHFDTSQDPDFFTEIGSVHYIPDMAEKIVWHFPDTTDMQPFIRLLTTKCNSWNGEQEVRVLKFSKKSQIQHFKPEALKSIILGTKFSENEDNISIDEIRNLAKKYPNATIYESIPDPNKFGILTREMS